MRGKKLPTLAAVLKTALATNPPPTEIVPHWPYLHRCPVVLIVALCMQLCHMDFIVTWLSQLCATPLHGCYWPSESVSDSGHGCVDTGVCKGNGAAWLVVFYHQIGFGSTSLSQEAGEVVWDICASLQYPGKMGDTLCQLTISWEAGDGGGGEIFAPAYSSLGSGGGGEFEPALGDTLCQLTVSREERWGILCASLQYPKYPHILVFLTTYLLPEAVSVRNALQAYNRVQSYASHRIMHNFEHVSQQSTLQTS